MLRTNSHQLPPRIVQRPPPRADKTPVFQPILLFRTKGPPSSCTRAIKPTPHSHPWHYAPWSWPKGCVEAHQRLCYASGPQRPGGRLLQACPRVDPVRGTLKAGPLLTATTIEEGVGPALLPATADSDPSRTHARTRAWLARSAVLCRPTTGTHRRVQYSTVLRDYESASFIDVDTDINANTDITLCPSTRPSPELPAATKDSYQYCMRSTGSWH